MKKNFATIIGLVALTLLSCLKIESPVALDTPDTPDIPDTSGILQITSTILSASDIGDWSNAGVQGGIPQYPVEVNVRDYGAIGDGVTDDTQAILDAIAACTEESAVHFPAGTYLITEGLTLSKSIVLRGDGPNTTHIISRHQYTAINVASNWAGIEDIHVHTDWPHFSGYQGTKIVFEGVENSWARNIETSGYVGFTVLIEGSSHCEVRDSYIHNSEEETNIIYDPDMDHAYFSSYGIMIIDSDEGIGASYNLVENNIFTWFRHAMVVQEYYDNELSNNVFGYNFSWYCWSHYNSGELGGDFSQTTDMEFHNGSSHLALVEGNVFDQGGIGREHNNNTVFRNRITNGGITVGSENNIVGNEFTESKGFGLARWGNAPRGSNIGTCIVHGNYIVDGDRIQWDSNIEDHAVPNSLYLSAKPEWFGDLEWPPYGGDLMPGNTRQTPAESRFWAMQSK